MNFHPEAEVVSCGTAGAFKKFGLSAPTDPNLVELEKMIAQRLDYVVVSSQKVAPTTWRPRGWKEKILSPWAFHALITTSRNMTWIV